MDFAVLCHGHNPPRPEEGMPFDYLELGSGMGLSLCLLAAAYPEGQFTGVDFHPDHIAHSRWLADALGLGNIHFLEADFLALQQDMSPLGLRPGLSGRFQYVAAHGIATWITPTIQAAMLAVASIALVPGGVFYCSYNTYPGWLGLSLFQHLSQLERGRVGFAGTRAAYDRTLQTLHILIGNEDRPTVLGSNLPSLRQDLLSVEKASLHYLTGEYANAGWCPLYVADMHRRCHDKKLRYVASATLPETFDELLSESLHEAVLSEADPLIRQSLIDFATNKSFRRDLFVRGFRGLTVPQRDRRFSAMRLCLQEAPPQDTYSFATVFGEVKGDHAAYSQIEEVLTSSPHTIAHLIEETGQPLPVLVKILAMLLHAGRLGLDRGSAGPKAREGSLQANRQLSDFAIEGSPYSFLVAPYAGTAIPFTTTDSLVHKALSEGLQGELLTACVQMGLTSLGAQLRDHENKPITNPALQSEAINTLILQYQAVRLPALRSLGALAEGSPGSTASPPGR
ncbi:class I SAM-dependent methyltransferase [Vulcanococcus limneticus]|uniref:class I SAM-dependent methyltransferase n=1 Tax=Vulcanococcus limneticus TaxID=2170428 RepID=UPI00398BF1D6